MGRPLDLTGIVDEAITVLGDTIIAHGRTVPDGDATGYKPGCIFIDTYSGAVYINHGDIDSADFTLIGSVGNLNIVESLGLVENSAGAATANRVAIKAAIDAGAPVSEWLFNGSSGNGLSIHTDKTIKVTGSGRKWSGLGKSISQAYDPDYSQRLLLRADTRGQTITTTGVSGSPTITLTNRAVDASDQYNSVQLTYGWYTIVSVNTSANTWTLRSTTAGTDPTNAGANLHPTGFYCPELFQFANLGMTVEGLNFWGALEGDTHTARVGIHTLTGEQTSGAPTGKHHFDGCSFYYFDYPLLFGPGMAGFGSGDDWDGSTDSYADNIYSSDMYIGGAKDCYVTRCDQAVVHRLFGYRLENLSSSFLRVDAGGKHHVDGLEVSGVAGDQCLVKLGKRAAQGVDGTITVSNFSYDGDANTRNPQLLVTDFPSGNSHRRVHVAFRDGIINRDPANVAAAYLVDVKSAVYATFEDIQYGNYGFSDGTVKMVAEDGAWKPDLHFSRVSMDVTNLEDVIDLANSTGGTASFSNCWAGGVRKPDGVYEVTAANTGHWAYQETFV